MLENLELVLEGERQTIEQQSIYQQLVYAEQSVDVALPEPASPLLKLPENQPHFELKNVTVQYGDKVILDHLNWVVQPHENWWIKGPNGAGKSTLLSLITGDHPQAFSNHVVIFGRQRGSGETIWDIKTKDWLRKQPIAFRLSCEIVPC